MGRRRRGWSPVSICRIPRDPARSRDSKSISQRLSVNGSGSNRGSCNTVGWACAGPQRGEYDAVIAGLEITSERLPRKSLFIALLLFHPQHDRTARRNTNPRIRRPATHTVGTLKASLAERYLNELGGTDIKTYDNQAHPYIDLVLGRLDAVVMDTPIALYYAYGPQFHNVELTSTSFPSPSASERTTRLLASVNDALGQMKADGTLEIFTSIGAYITLPRPTTSATETPSAIDADRYREYLDCGSNRTILSENTATIPVVHAPFVFEAPS